VHERQNVLAQLDRLSDATPLLQRKAREYAAKKAREEAAERSRALSKAWAEKKKALAAAAAAPRAAGGVGIGSGEVGRATPMTADM